LVDDDITDNDRGVFLIEPSVVGRGKGEEASKTLPEYEVEVWR